MRQGFSLIQISILLIAASLVLVAVLPNSRSGLNAASDTTARMHSLLTALRGYQAAHAALPCPADASQPIGGTGYGVAATNPGTSTNCNSAANYVDSTNHVAIGLVPVRTLGLPNDYALDSYGHALTYAVDTNATSCFSGSLTGQITVTDNGTANSTVAALVSHGANGHGAWIPLTGTSGTGVRLNSGSTDTNELLNAHVNSSFTPTATLNQFVRAIPNATFDDLVVYKSNPWTLNTAPVIAASLLPSVTPPTNGSYYTGQALTFTVTFGSPIAVSGTPRLTLSVPQASGGSLTRYATYVSTSGNAATFTYTVQSTDYAPSAPSAVSIGAAIDLNGGSITSGGVASCLTFTAPSLTGILLNPTTVYVMDYGNNRIQLLDGVGNFRSQIGCGGTSACSSSAGDGQFNQPGFGVLDASGNLFVGDQGNYRIQKFDSNGVYQTKFGSNGSGNGQFTNLQGIARDSVGNVYAADYGNDRIQKFNNSGVYQSKFGSAGGGNGQFANPAGVAVDSGGNIWVADFSNNNVQEFNGSGVFQAKIGSTGIGNGQFTAPNSVTFDGAGNFWVAEWTNNRIQKFDSGGNYLFQFGSAGSGNGQFSNPAHVAVDPSGNLWVSDFSNNRVQEFTSCGIFIRQVGSVGTTAGLFRNPVSVAVTGTPGATGACITAIAPPSSAAYNTGQILSFTVTYNANVTVTGTPRLVLTIGGNTRYATYASGSGTTMLTFTYTIQAGDSATGITSASVIDLNGGTIASGGANADLNYTPPNMSGISVNTTAFLLVADQLNNRVQKFDLLGNYISKFGTAGNGNGQFNHPAGAIVDGSGNIWVADTSNNRVQEFNSSFVYQTQFGSAGAGNGQFNGPSQVSIDGSGNLYVSDYSNCRIQKFNSSGVYQSQFGSCGAGNGQFNGPDYIHFDSTGNIYVSEWGNSRVQKFTSNGVFVKAFSAISGYGTLNGVNAHVIDGCNNIWIEDASNNKLVALDYSGNYVSSIAEPSGPQGLTIDANGNLYDLDAFQADGIKVFSSSGTLLRSFGSTGSGNGQFNTAVDINTVASSPPAKPLSQCSAVILSVAGPANGTYTTGNTLSFTVTYDQAVAVTGTPQIPIVIGANTRQASYASGSGTATLTFNYTVAVTDNANNGITMNVPIGLTGGTISSNSIASGLYFQTLSLPSVQVNAYLNFYIADTSSHAVRKVTASTGYISTVAGTGVAGSTNDNNGSLATGAKLSAPSGVAVDASNNIYIADSTNHTVLEVANATGIISIVAGTGTAGSTNDNNNSAATSARLSAPSGVAVDSSSNIYIADSTNHTVLKVTNATGKIAILAGTGASGTTHENDGSQATSALLAAPTGVALDSSNNVYISDNTNDVVLKVTVSTGVISYAAGTGTTGSTNDNNGSLATAARLAGPKGIALDSSNNLYIADATNQTILKVMNATGIISVLGGTTGSSGTTGDGGAATSATLSAPSGVAVDSLGGVYIADMTNNRARWVLASNINNLAGTGLAGYTGDGAAATSAKVNAPAGIAVSR